jgi:hypothetical protein
LNLHQTITIKTYSNYIKAAIIGANSDYIKFVITSIATSCIKAATTRTNLDYIKSVVIVVGTSDIRVVVIGVNNITTLNTSHV